jgi:CBS domain-containing protein
MRISDILRSKGQDGTDAVFSIGPDQTVHELIGLLAEHRIGALVVGSGTDVVGIVSERDVVRKLHQLGAPALDAPVRDLMTSPAQTCAPTDPVDEIAETMTTRRFRHMPVMENGVLVGVVSIGDVVKNRIRELEIDRNTLEQYVTG